MNRISFADNMIDCDATKSIAPDISTSPTTALQHDMWLLLLDDCTNGVEIVPPPPPEPLLYIETHDPQIVAGG